ncbi:sirohydrochlorin ferrochelatase [Gracilibacillus alcaliphilus]|nr:sirohydrochlorin ferrochelatase [Gracilibacillus alcaliphilus]
MEAIIYICHGSRVKQSKHESMQLIKRVQREVDVPIQSVCFLELQEPGLSEAVAEVAEKGATSIAIIPILLLTAGHAKRDIPELIEREQAKYPEVDFHYGRAIEVDSRMVEALADRIRELPSDQPETFDLLLVGRGSSDPDVVHDMEQIAAGLQPNFPNNLVDVCFLAAAEPKFEELLLEKVKQGKSVIVLPYLLFTGLLDKGIKEYIDSLEVPADQQILVADYLGHHSNVVKILVERTEEARKGVNRPCSNG